MKNLKKEIREICTFHGEEGTSGYLLSEEQFEKIFDVLGRVKENVRVISIPPEIRFNDGKKIKPKR